MTTLLPFIPEHNGYNVRHPAQVVSSVLDGGRPRVRSDVLGANGSVSATWMLEGVEYDQFMRIWEESLAFGALPALVDLVTSTFLTARHRVTFVPDSLRTTQVEGLTYRVSAELSVEQLKRVISSATFGSPNIVTLEANIDDLLDDTDRVQIVGARYNDGIRPPVNLDGIYAIDSLPELFQIELTDPEDDNEDWLLLADYPGDVTGFVQNVSIIRSPT